MPLPFHKTKLVCTIRQLQFSFGVHAVHEPEAPRAWDAYSRDWLQTHDLQADILVLAQGHEGNTSDDNYTMEIVDLKQTRGIANAMQVSSGK